MGEAFKDQIFFHRVQSNLTLVMMPKKSPVSHIVFSYSKQCLQNKKRNLTESTGVVLAKYPPKVKLELYHNFRVTELE